MHRQILELVVDDQPEQQTERDDDQAPQQQRPAADSPAEKCRLAQIGQAEVSFSTGLLL